MNKQRKIKRHNKITPIWAMLVVLATVYTLIIPAITMGHDFGIYCGQEEHKHSSSCYAQITAEEIPVLICDKEENKNHSHGDTCYAVQKLVCSSREHTHSLACQSNPEADIETPEDYSQAASRVELIGLLREDIISIAETQLGYSESEANFAVAEDGETKKGYTRYGEWYGDKYGDWSGMFVSFCLKYAKVENSLVSYEADHERRISELNKRRLYHKAGEKYRPRAGDLVFFDLDKYKPQEQGKRRADRVGFVYELIYDETKKLIGIKVIEGDYENRVAINEYDIIDDTIIGYGEIPERDINVSLCDCGCEDAELAMHGADCARKAFAEKLGEVKSAESISKLWNKLPKDVCDAVCEYLAKTDSEKHRELNALVALLPQISEKVTSVDGLDFLLTGPFQSSMQANVSGIEGTKLDGLKEYLEDTDNHLLSGAYDISVVEGESKAYFDEPIKVMISGLDIGKIDTKKLRVKVYHLVGVDEEGVSELNQNTEVEMMYATLDENGNLCFETEDFSVFYFTVDFHYEDLTYIIEGNSSTTLSKLFENLELPFNSSNAVNVEFSNPEYISVRAVYDELNEITDWELTSLAPFTTKETLTVNFADGSTLAIDVTDSQVPEYEAQGETTVTVDFSNASGSVEVLVELLKNGVPTGQTLMLNSSNSWEGSFKGLEPADYTIEYTLPNGYIAGVNSSSSTTKYSYSKANNFEEGKTYVLIHNSSGTNYAVQNSSKTTVSRSNKVTISNNTITSTSSVSDAMRWSYNNGALQNVNTKNYLQLSTSDNGTVNTSSSVMNHTYYQNSKIVQKVNNSNRYLKTSSTSYRTDTSESSGTNFTLYEETGGTTTIDYDILIENIGYNSDEHANDFEHNKEIDYLNDGTVNSDTDLSGEDYYRLYLDMTGKQEPMDLLIIVDGSGSMTANSDMNDGMRRDAAVTEFLNGSTSKVTEDGFIPYFLGLNSQNMVSVVQFYGGVDDVTIGTQPSTTSNSLSYTHDTKILLDWTTTAKFVNCEGKEANGTNYEAGLRRATEVLGSSAVRGNGHRKIMIFLSDGVPTFFQVDVNDVGFVANYPVYNNGKYTYYDYTIQASDVGKRFGHGWNTDFVECKDTSKTAFDDFLMMNPGITVFTIGVSEDINSENTDTSQHPEVLKYMAEKGGGEFYGVEHDMHLLKVQLESIFYPSGVVIKDELSKYVRYYEENPDVIVTMTHRATNEVSVLYRNGAVTTAGKGILKSVSYTAGDTSENPNESTGTVLATFESNYRFSPEYTYKVSFNVKTTQTAYDEYAKDGYNAVGDDDTDYGTNSTSSLKPGFHSNDRATAIYVISGKEKQNDYLHPVVQVETESITVKKEWADTLNADEHNAIQVALMLNHTQDGVTTKTQIGEAVTLSANNGWSYTFENLPKYHVVSNGYQYTVEEVKVPDGYNAEYTSVNENGEITWVVTNSLKGNLLVQKVDSFGEVISIAGITFELYSDEALTDKLGTYVTDAEGKLTINGLFVGKIYWIVETLGPPGYKPMEGAQPIMFTPNGVDAEMLVNNKYLSVDEEGVLLIKNFRGYELPETGSYGEALMYGLGIVLVSVAVIGGYVLKIKAKEPRKRSSA